MAIFAQQPPWYAAGLAFDCLGCGDCCAGPEEGYVWVSQDEIAAIAEHLSISPAELWRRYVRKAGGRCSLVERPGNHDCIFLDDDAGGRKCSIYPVRPLQCRTWPFWTSNLASPNTWAMAGARCPGINRGRAFSFDEIKDRLNRTPS